jgi:hypothetical protein
MKPQIEEFMVFEDEDGRMGVVIESDNENYKWWKCYKSENVNGQIFNEIENDDNYNIIKKLYKTTFGNKRFYAFKFMSIVI